MKLNFEQKKKLYKIQFRPMHIFGDVFDLLDFKLRDIESEGHGEICYLTSENCFYIVLKMVNSDIERFKQAFDTVIGAAKKKVIDHPMLTHLKNAIPKAIKFVDFIYEVNEINKSDKQTFKKKDTMKRERDVKNIKLNSEQKKKLSTMKFQVSRINGLFGEVFDILDFELRDIECEGFGMAILLRPKHLLYLILGIIESRNKDFMEAFETVIRVKKNEFLNRPILRGTEEIIDLSIKFVKFVYKVNEFNGSDIGIPNGLVKLEKEMKHAFEKPLTYTKPYVTHYMGEELPVIPSRFCGVTFEDSYDKANKIVAMSMVPIYMLNIYTLCNTIIKSFEIESLKTMSSQAINYMKCEERFKHMKKEMTIMKIVYRLTELHSMECHLDELFK